MYAYVHIYTHPQTHTQTFQFEVNLWINQKYLHSNGIRHFTNESPDVHIDQHIERIWRAFLLFFGLLCL